ncbi:hypothetical protein K0M31_009388 [Melipona bicolor]|uniref:Uncharacterized protein n=1 Tax=Melipona bicolor TaxID=60889 RepID=A0AA40KJ39_9HYME|nr:hypothetical protein K0M31_009388 [Melipona bicolor]
MSRQLRGERDHVSRCDLRERDLRDFRDLHEIRDPRDFRDFRDVRDIRDERDDPERSRDDYLDYDHHHPTAASTSAFTNNPVRRSLERKGPLETKVKAFDTTVAWKVISSGYHYCRSRLEGAYEYEAWSVGRGTPVCVSRSRFLVPFRKKGIESVGPAEMQARIEQFFHGRSNPRTTNFSIRLESESIFHFFHEV